MKNNSIKKFFTVMVVFTVWTSNAQSKFWTLEECVTYALENNISIKASELDEELATISKKDAIGNFLPSLNANASHSWNIGLNQNITTGLLQNQTIQFTAVGMNVQVDIYNGLQNQSRLRRANLFQMSSQYQLLKMQEDIGLNVANAFLQILFNKENLKVRKEQLSFDQKQMERTKELLDAGLIPAGDLLDMKATASASQQQVTIAENALLISKLSLAQLLQLREFRDFDIQDPNFQAEQNVLLLMKPEEIYEKAKEIRTELKIARTNLEIAEKDIKIAKGAYQPNLRGFYSFNTRSSNSDSVTGFEVDPDNPTSPIGFVEQTNQLVVQPNFIRLTGGPVPTLDQFDTNKGQSVGVQLNVPIFNGFSVRNSVDRSKVEYERSKVAYEQQELDLARNVYTAFTDATGALNSYEAALETAEARKEAFRYAKERYDVGLMNSFDFNQSQTLFVNSLSEVLRTKYDYIFRIKILEFYFGIPIIQKP
jgi:outer membrane protein